ncbi:MAG: extracellular solute-binding protein [Acidimicrobiia bacterium]|nr:extracellular solute-binding protein [Acidimicrobiia bacterium]
MTADSLLMPFEWRPTSIDHFLAMANGQAAMGIESSSALSTVLLVVGGGTVADTGGLDPDALGADDIDAEGFDIGVAPLPAIGTGAGGYQAGGAAAFIAEGSSAADRVGAWDFISFMSDPDEQAQWHIASSFTPMSAEAAALPELQTYWAQTPQQKLSWRCTKPTVTAKLADRLSAHMTRSARSWPPPGFERRRATPQLSSKTHNKRSMIS